MVIGKVITVTGWGNTEENVSYEYINQKITMIKKDTNQLTIVIKIVPYNFVSVPIWNFKHLMFFFQGPYSTVLRAVRVPIISKENCQHVPFPYFRGSLTARMFCAGFSEGKKDACQVGNKNIICHTF